MQTPCRTRHSNSSKRMRARSACGHEAQVSFLGSDSFACASRWFEARGTPSAQKNAGMSAGVRDSVISVDWETSRCAAAWAVCCAAGPHRMRSRFSATKRLSFDRRRSANPPLENQPDLRGSRVSQDLSCPMGPVSNRTRPPSLTPTGIQPGEESKEQSRHGLSNRQPGFG